MGILSVSKRWEILKGKYIEDEQWKGIVPRRGHCTQHSHFVAV
jgi:hypothetical protein